MQPLLLQPSAPPSVAATVLAVLSNLPGRKLLQRLLPLALGGGASLWCLQPGCTARADSPSPGSVPDSKPATQNAAAQPSRGSGQPGGAGASLPEVMSKLLGDNQFANGGLTLMLVGAAAAGARVMVGSAVRYCKRHVMVQAEVDSRDDAYRWLMHWLSRHPKFSRATNVSVTTNLTGTFGTSIPALSAAAVAGGGGPPVAFLPAPGDHLLSYKGRWMLISRQRTSGNPQLAANARLLLETLRISMLGTDRQPLEELIAEAASEYNASQACRTAVHSVDQDGYWTQVGSRPIRPLGTVVLPPGQAESLLSDCQDFLASEDWYAHHGIPFRRGYLLYGPPGTGKTSLAVALAGALGLEIYVITLSSPTMTDETLRGLLNTAGTRSILLLEDVDAAFVDRSAAQSAGGRLTFSGLLNAIDGVAAQEGRLLFMTTNHIERLSPALIRPGRVDVRCFLGPASREVAKKMFLSFYRDLPKQQMQLALGGSKAAAGTNADTGVKEGAGGVDLAVRPAGTAGTAAADAAGESAEAQPLLEGGRQMSLLTRASREAEAEREASLAALADKFSSKLPQQPEFSTAQLQAFLMAHRLEPEQAVSRVEQWLKEQRMRAQEEQEGGGV